MRRPLGRRRPPLGPPVRCVLRRAGYHCPRDRRAAPFLLGLAIDPLDAGGEVPLTPETPAGPGVSCQGDPGGHGADSVPRSREQRGADPHEGGVGLGGQGAMLRRQRGSRAEP